MSVTQAPRGIWMPQARVLCFACHGPRFDRRTLSETEFASEVSTLWEPDMAEGFCVCDGCGRTVIAPFDVAAYSRLRDALLGMDGVDAKLEQTGGMCAALRVCRTGTETPFVFVGGYGDMQIDGRDAFWIGLYSSEDAMYDGEPDLQETTTPDMDLAVRHIRGMLGLWR